MAAVSAVDPVDSVVDDVDAGRLVLVQEGLEAELVYRTAPDLLVLVHTGVPEQLGGRGLGGVLVRRAVRKAVAEGRAIAPWCPFARRWLEQHPDEAAAITIDWSPPPTA